MKNHVDELDLSISICKARFVYEYIFVKIASKERKDEVNRTHFNVIK